MIIWAIVTQDTYNKLKKGSSVFCMIEDSPWGKTMSSVTGYQFVARYMERKSGKFAPAVGAVPFIGWVRYPGDESHPDPKDDFLYKYGLCGAGCSGGRSIVKQCSCLECNDVRGILSHFQ